MCSANATQISEEYRQRCNYQIWRFKPLPNSKIILIWMNLQLNKLCTFGADGVSKIQNLSHTIHVGNRLKHDLITHNDLISRLKPSLGFSIRLALQTKDRMVYFKFWSYWFSWMKSEPIVYSQTVTKYFSIANRIWIDRAVWNFRSPPLFPYLQYKISTSAV